MDWSNLELNGRWKDIAEKSKEERESDFMEMLLDSSYRCFKKIPGHPDFYDGLTLGVINAIEFMEANPDKWETVKKKVLEG